jgi:PHD/YefM family antitoxin component YafN of YafNO toxin-antitoxin module
MRTQQIEPVSEMVKNYRGLLAKLGNGPVYLAARSKPAAVLVSPSEWDNILDELEALQDKVDVLEAEVEFLRSGEQLEDADLDELRQMAGRDAVPA